MAVHVFVDESDRGDCHLLAATVVPVTRLDPTRKLMRGLLASRQRSIHFKDENPGRRRAILAALTSEITEPSSWIYLGRGHREDVRAECLRQLVADALKARVQRLVLDWREPPLDRVDEATIARTLNAMWDESSMGCEKPSYEHMPRHQEPALWLSDVVAWCYGAEQEWRRHVTPLIENVTNLGKITR
jgi:hypothetical protein